MTTKKIISDDILYKLSGGKPDSGFPIDERDIWNSLEQEINAAFKIRHFDTTLPSGETIPENTMIGTYENITVTSLGNGKSKAVLPITPVSLPKNVGIYLVYDPRYPDMPFIPLQRGQTALLRTDTLLSDVMGQITYEPKNSLIVFNRDLTLFGTTVVTMELCVFDMDQYGINDMLPIPADYVDQIIIKLLQEFSPVTAESGQVNNWTTAGQNVIKP